MKVFVQQRKASIKQEKHFRLIFIVHILFDAHACGREDTSLQVARMRRSGSLCEP